MDVEDAPRQEFREWAERNGYRITVDEGESGEIVAVGEGGSLEVRLSKYGNVHLTKHVHLGGEGGEINISDKQITVVNSRGQEHRISPGRYPDK